MIANLVFTSIAAVLGIMLFFSFVVAPVGFKSLNEKQVNILDVKESNQNGSTFFYRANVNVRQVFPW